MPDIIDDSMPRQDRNGTVLAFYNSELTTAAYASTDSG